jgi:hypothetical protein
LLATTVAGGAKAPWLGSYSETLSGRDVVILSDNDPAGIACAHTRAESLSGIARRVKVVLLPDLPAKGDVSDWLDVGHTRADPIQIMKKSTDWKRESDADQRETAPSNGLALITAGALMRKVLLEPPRAVPGIFPEGLSPLVGAPKQWKS